MAKQTIQLGIVANDGTGDTMRVALDKVNDNFTELYDIVVPAVGLFADFPQAHSDFRGQSGLATNARKSGETAGNGTGCPIWCDGTNWRTFYDNSVVAT